MNKAPGLAADLLKGADAAADYLGLSTRSVYHMTAAGQLPHVKKGKRLYFRRSELDAAFSAETPTVD